MKLFIILHINNNRMKLKEPYFTVALLPEATAFVNEQETKVREKIAYNINKAQYVMDNELLKKLDGEIWEFRTLYNGICYRLLAFWDPNKKRLILATHGFVKKTNKTPKQQIEKAEEIRKKYLAQYYNKEE